MATGSGRSFSGWGRGRSRRFNVLSAGGRARASPIELSTGGLKISSPVLGVIILGLSLAFFYLYLVYVYPIAETL
jgi:hypothetical protein